MSSFWETKFLNAEKSIQFMQEAHAEVLKGLHGEIETLQKQCADYALRLSLQAATSVEKDEYDKKFKKYNVEYKKRDDLISEQKKLIEERNRNIKTLEERVRTLEKKNESDLAARDNLIKQCKLQLDSQSLQIANLTYQLHNLRNIKQNDAKVENESDSKIFKKINSPKVTKKSSRLKEELKEFEANTRKNSKTDELPVSEFVAISETRTNSAQSNSPRSRSITPPVQKVLPPVIKRVSEVVPPPDPKPFLLSAASTLHTRSRKDYLQRKALISLPPIKPYELNHLAVESPLKIGHKNTNFVQNYNNDQNNTSS